MGKQDIDIKISLSLVGLVLIAASFLLNAHAFADDVVDQINITVPESCSVEGVIATGGEHTKTVQNNQYYSEIGTTTFKTYCNDNNGYAIYAVGYSNDEIGNTLMKHNVSSAYDFDTGTATSGNTSDWAMKLTAISGTYAPTIHSDTNGAFSSYHVVPSAYTKVVSFASNTDLPASGVNATGSGFTSTYASWISATQVAGTYTGKVKYTLVHPASEEPLQPHVANSGCINYFANASSAVGSMGCQSISASATTAKLYASNFSREGYGFAGWSDAYDYVTNANAHFYGPNEDITFTAGQYTSPNNGLSLYAVWVKSAGNLQDSSRVATLCGTGTGSLTTATYNNEGDSDESTWSITAGLSSVSALTDTRDNQTYAIAKLADGKCWMIENLRLADTHQEGNNTVATTLTLANTNNPLNDGTDVTLKHNYADTQTYNTLSATSNVAYNADTAPDGWCTTNSAACDDQSRLRTDNTANRVSYAQNANMSNDANLYSYGNYYNWYSATAGRGTYSTGSGVTVAGDLCPAGWHLPTGTGSGEFGLLSNSLGGYKNASNVAQAMSSSTTPTGTIMNQRIRHFPNNFLHSGSVGGASLGSRGTNGIYWSSTAYSSSYAYVLLFYSTNVSPGASNGYKYSGRTIRCMVSPSA